MAPLPALKPLDDRAEKFVGLYVETGDPVQAARDAGYSDSTANAARTKLLASAHIAWALAIAVRKRLAESAPMALNTIRDLAKGAESEKVRLEAAKALIDRAGYVAPRPISEKSNADRPLHEMNMSELQALAARLEDELAGRAKPVSSAQAAPQESQGIDLIG